MRRFIYSLLGVFALLCLIELSPKLSGGVVAEAGTGTYTVSPGYTVKMTDTVNGRGDTLFTLQQISTPGGEYHVTYTFRICKNGKYPHINETTIQYLTCTIDTNDLGVVGFQWGSDAASAAWVGLVNWEGCSYEFTGFSVNPHSYSTTSNATCTSAGSKKCATCGKTVSIAALGHDYSSKTKTSTYLKSSATCTDPTIYYYKCSRCTAKGTTTYTDGSALGHNWIKSSVYLNPTAYSTGEQSWVCSRDGTHTTRTTIPQSYFNIFSGNTRIKKIYSGSQLVYDASYGNLSFVKSGGEAPTPDTNLTTYDTLSK